MLATKQRISRSRGLLLTRRRQLLRDRLAGQIQRSLERYFKDQATHAVAVFLNRETRARDDGGLEYKNLNPNEIIPGSDNLKLTRLLEGRILEMIMLSSESAALLVGTEAFTNVHPVVVRLLTEAGQRIVQINDVTRQAVQETLNAGMARGLSDFQIARGVTEQVDAVGNVTREAFRGLRDVVEETYTGRAQTIARTEMAMANNQASAETYRMAGVTEVDIRDGISCGWLFHEDSDLADGSRRTLGEYLQTPLSHPNCLRSDVPVLP